MLIDNISVESAEFLSLSGFSTDTDTFPKLLKFNYQNHPDEISMRNKRYGIWNEYTWKDCYLNTRKIALGLTSLGIIRGDKVIVPKGNTQILPNDEIIALTKIAQEKEVIKCLLGGV